MENFAVDLDKLLDDFELDEGQCSSRMGILLHFVLCW